MPDAPYAEAEQQDLAAQVSALRAELEALKARNEESQETLRAIRSGEADAVIAATPDGDRIFTLEGAEHPYRIFVENIGEGAVTLAPDGTILYCNPGFARLAQRSQDELVGSSFLDHLPAEHHELAAALLKQSASRKCKGEAELRTAEGFSVPVQLSVSDLGLRDPVVRCMLVTDLTEQKRSRELHSQERLTRSILEQTAEAVIICDEKGMVLRANRKALSWAGSDIHSRPFSEAFDLRDTAGRPVPRFISDMAGGRRPPNAELTLLRDNGAPLHVIGNAAPLATDTRTVAGILVTLYDITEQKTAEEALRESRKQWQELAGRYAVLSETSGQLLQAADPQKAVESLCRTVMEYLGCQVFFNYLSDEKAGKLRLNACGGVPADEAKQLEWLDYGSAVCGCAARDNCCIVIEHVQTTPDPRARIVRSFGVKAYACHPLPDKDGKALGTLSFGTKDRDTFHREELSLMRAVTDQVAAAISRLRYEEALREMKERFQNVLDNSLDAAYRWDLRSDTYDYLSPVIGKITGYTAEEFSRFALDSVLQLIHPDDIDAADASAGKAMTTAERSGIAEYRLKGKDGSWRWLSDRFTMLTDEKGEPRYRVGVVRDITLHRKAEEALRESEERFRTVVENSMDAIVMTDPSGGGRILWANPAAGRLFGWPEREMTGLTREDILVADDTRLRSFMKERETAGAFRGELLYKRRDGSTFTGELSSTMITDGKGNKRAVVIIRDVTELRAAEKILRSYKETLERLVDERSRELLKAHAELERSRRMSDIGRLSSTIAHEIRNPLSAIRTAAYNIQRKAKNPLLDKHLETINKKVLESNQIINNLLSFVRIRSASFEHVRIHDTLKDCIGTVSAKYAGWAVELKERLDCAPEDTIVADHTQFRMLVSNILDNAYQALPGKAGEITLAARRKNDEAWEIAIADTGTGIDKEDQERIFDPFFTTKSKGTGLGLAVCREIVDLHGGTIAVRSAKGEGTAFTITLPFRPPNTPPPQSV